MNVPVTGITPAQLDDYLGSDRSPPNYMMMSDLDGFLTGLAVGPSVVVPSEWLPVVWGGEGPVFDDENEMRVVMGGIFSRYNNILRQVESGAVAPFFWKTPDDTVIATGWAEGFLEAMKLRWDEWGPLFQSRKHAVSPFRSLALCCDQLADPLLHLDSDAEDLVVKEAPALIPDAVLEVARFWLRRDPGRAGTIPRTAHHALPALRRSSDATSLAHAARVRSSKKCCGQ